MGRGDAIDSSLQKDEPQSAANRVADGAEVARQKSRGGTAHQLHRAIREAPHLQPHCTLSPSFELGSYKFLCEE